MQHDHVTLMNAPELRVAEWLRCTGPEGLRIVDIDDPIIYLYCFQSWCPGCHSHGFPTMKSVKDQLEAKGLGDQVQFIAVQTVFEGHDENTAEKAIESVDQHGLTDIPVGHDSGHPPTIMEDYATGGTPWTILIGPDRKVLFGGFSVDADAAVAAISGLLEELAA